MKSVSRNKSNYTGFKRILYSTKYSLEGLIYAYRHEKSLWIHAGISIVSIILGLVLQISLTQWSIILIGIGVILAIELINTAIEAVVDMVTLEYNDLAKIAKDCGSAATFVATTIGLIIGIVVFGPKILKIIGFLR